MELKLTSQKSVTDAIKPKLADMKMALDSRAEVWTKIPREAKLKWIKSGKDPLMTQAWETHKGLKAFFGEVDNG